SDVCSSDLGFAIRFELGKHAALGAETHTFGPGFATNEAHYFIHQIDRSRRAVGDLQIQTQISKAHNAEAHRTGALHHVNDFRQRPGAGVDHVVQKTRAKMCDFGETIPVETILAIVELVHVDRAEVTRVCEVQKLFTAGVAR